MEGSASRRKSLEEKPVYFKLRASSRKILAGSHAVAVKAKRREMSEARMGLTRNGGKPGGPQASGGRGTTG